MSPALANPLCARALHRSGVAREVIQAFRQDHADFRALSGPLERANFTNHVVALLLIGRGGEVQSVRGRVEFDSGEQLYLWARESSRVFALAKQNLVALRIENFDQLQPFFQPAETGRVDRREQVRLQRLKEWQFEVDQRVAVVSQQLAWAQQQTSWELLAKRLEDFVGRLQKIQWDTTEQRRAALRQLQTTHWRENPQLKGPLEVLVDLIEQLELVERDFWTSEMKEQRLKAALWQQRAARIQLNGGHSSLQSSVRSHSDREFWRQMQHMQVQRLESLVATVTARSVVDVKDKADLVEGLKSEIAESLARLVLHLRRSQETILTSYEKVPEAQRLRDLERAQDSDQMWSKYREALLEEIRALEGRVTSPRGRASFERE